MAKSKSVSGIQMEFGVVFLGDKQGSEAVAKSRAAKQLSNAEVSAARHEEDLSKIVLLEREKENFRRFWL